MKSEMKMAPLIFAPMGAVLFAVVTGVAASCSSPRSQDTMEGDEQASRSDAPTPQGLGRDTAASASSSASSPTPTNDVDDGPPQSLVEEARSLSRRFMTDLKGELQAAIQEDGPSGAIGVCRRAAPSIAGELSEKNGWAVGRTSLRVRNPRNSPSVDERAVLMSFQARAAAGEDLQSMEHVAVRGDGGQRHLHYMKAIPTGSICLTCHGSDVAETVQEAIRENYPADAATGFERGELRGAFTFVKPL
jgi:hypothetical protein